MTELLTAVAIIFIVAGPFLLIANRYDVPAAPLLIVGGLLAGFFIDEADLLDLAQIGIAMLVFAFGGGIQLSTVETVLRDSEIAALIQIAVIGTLGTGFGLLLGTTPTEALILGMAAALSSTIVATALLQTEIRMDLIRGRLATSIHFVQDFIAILFLLILGAGVWELDPIVLQIGYGTVFLLLAVAINRYLFGFLGRLASGSVELMIIGVISLLVVFIGLAEAVDIPIVIGAFAAGIAVRHDPTVHQGLFNGMESIKDFFVAIFFAVVGALVVLPFIEMGVTDSLAKLQLVVGLVVLTAIVKPIVTTAILIARGYEARSATLTGLSTDQISEFSVIIAIEALILGVLTQEVFDAIILAAAATMITSTFTQRYDEELYRVIVDRVDLPGRHEKIDSLSHVPEDISGHIIVLGYGQKGSRLTESIKHLGHPCVVIENDPALRGDVMKECDMYVFGDAMEPYTWTKANADDAIVIVSVTTSTVVSEQLLSYGFDASLILRATDESAANELLERGAQYVVVPDLLAGERLVTHVSGLLEGELSLEEFREIGIAELDRDGDQAFDTSAHRSSR